MKGFIITAVSTAVSFLITGFLVTGGAAIVSLITGFFTTGGATAVSFLIAGSLVTAGAGGLATVSFLTAGGSGYCTFR